VHTGPTGRPRDVEVVSNASSSAVVCWQLPVRSSWNGRLRGCVVSVRPMSSSTWTAVNVSDIAGSQCQVIGDLRPPSALYEVSLSCYNAACVGPVTDSVQFTVYDDVLQTAPTNVTARPVNSTCIQVSFLPPPFTDRSDLYYVITASRSQWTRVKREQADASAAVAVRGRLIADTVQSVSVTGLDKYTEYDVTVQCRTDIAAGPRSAPISVRTLDDGMSSFLHSSSQRSFA